MFALFLSRILVYFSRSLFSVCLCRLTEKKTNEQYEWLIYWNWSLLISQSHGKTISRWMKSKEGKLETLWNREIVQSIEMCDEVQLKMLVYLHKNSVYSTRFLISWKMYHHPASSIFECLFMYSLELQCFGCLAIRVHCRNVGMGWRWNYHHIRFDSYVPLYYMSCCL